MSAGDWFHIYVLSERSSTSSYVLHTTRMHSPTKCASGHAPRCQHRSPKPAAPSAPANLPVWQVPRSTTWQGAQVPDPLLVSHSMLLVASIGALPSRSLETKAVHTEVNMKYV